MKWWPTACRPGDLIRVRLKNGLWHYGVCTGEDEVIQFGLPPRGKTPPPEEIRVVSSDMNTFASDSFIEVAQLSLGERLRRKKPEETVRLARTSLGQGGYDLLRNNCEHFATACVFGKGFSLQAQKAAEGDAP